MSSRDNALWQQYWRDQRTDLHRTTVHPLLPRFWPGLDLVRGSRVFVPLCGKSRDMIWLAGQGHRVIGVELSPIAVRAFFRENRLQPSRRRVGEFTLWEQGRLAILCGDFFALTGADLGWVDAVYDRAALTALPEDVRRLYMAHLGPMLPAACKIFLLTTEDAEAGDANPVYAVADELKVLYSAAFEIDLVHVESGFETDPEAPNRPPERIEHKVHRLFPRGEGP